MNDYFFINEAPEAVGISSQSILDFIDELEKYNINMHGISLSVGNKVVAEGYWKPFHKKFQHRMYSIGKSFVALAIAFLEAEGQVSLEDKICDYFEKRLPEQVHPFIETMTIEDMLKMKTAHHTTTYKRYESDDWTESFFNVEPTNISNSFFAYDTSASHVLGALVEKLTGKKVLDYLREKFLDKIDFSQEATFLSDRVGISQGGSGLICTMEDIRKVAYILMQGGTVDGEAYVPEAFVREATTKKTATDFQPFYDERHGYGYQIWMSREEGFALYGLGGQLALCIPKYQLMLVTTADTQGDTIGTATIHRCFWDLVVEPYKANIGKTLEVNEEISQALSIKEDGLSVHIPNNDKSQCDQLKLLHGEYRLLMADIEQSWMAISGDTNKLKLHNNELFGGQAFEFGINELAFGKIYIEGEDLTFDYYGYCQVLETGLYQMTLKIIGGLCGEVKWIIAQHGDKFSLEVRNCGEKSIEKYRGIYNGYFSKGKKNLV